MKPMISIPLFLALLLPGLQIAAAQAPADPVPEALYRQRCAACHDHPQDRIPPRFLLGFRSPNAVVRTLTRGAMRPMAEGLDAAEIAGLATLLTGRAPGTDPVPSANPCARPGSPVKVGAHDWPVIGRDIAGTRFQPAPGLRVEDLPRLKLKWAFAYPEGASGPAQLAGGRVFLASGDGTVHSLDARSGCSYWSFDAGRSVRAVTVALLVPGSDRTAVIFGDDQGAVTALDATSGARLWRTEVETHPLARITAPPVVHEGRVYVPVSGMEDPLTHDPDYACCTHRGSVAALDASTGRLIWKRYTIEEAPRPLPGTGATGPKHFGPAGGSVFTPLGIDVRRRLVYAATAEAYGHENPPGAYSVIAFDMETGAHRWQRQFMPAEKDRARICHEAGESDCRNMFSMSTQVMVRALPGGREILLAGSKWGWMYALDPDANGRTLWRRKVGKGGDLGGIMYGPSADERTLYVPVADTIVLPPQRAGGLAALDLATGKVRWQIESEAPVCSWQLGRAASCTDVNTCDCSSAKVAATTAIPGAVFAGGWDGHVRAYSTRDGRLLWDVDTAVPVPAVNGIEARGGQVGGYPVVVSGGAVYITSGASAMGRPGNALLVFEPQAEGPHP
ncbi:MAG: PQQ-binding-like beta-propeller repeat protein [Gammaproteobacteria bacterium]|nr:PQQ-binding-like beta-propeller repeat protein [Gammaproteobacteria bacterium]